MAQNISFKLLTDFKSQFTGNSNLEIKLLESLKVNLLFPEKIILYSWTKLGILKSCTKIPWSRRFELGFWETSKQFDRKLQYTDNFLERFQLCLVLTENWFCIRRANLAFERRNQSFMDQKFSFLRVLRFTMLLQKNSFAFVYQIW